MAKSRFTPDCAESMKAELKATIGESDIIRHDQPAMLNDREPVAAPVINKGGRKKLPADKKKGARVSVYLVPEVYEKLAALAESEGDSLNRIVTKAIVKYCKEQ